MAKILVADKVTDEGLHLLEDDGSHEVIYRPEISQDELRTVIADCEAVVVRSRARITGDIIEAAPKLRVVGRAGVGLDNVDVPTATRCGVIVMNAPEGNTISTAEHTFAMMMAAARKIPQADAVMKSGGWDKSKFKGIELRDKTGGVIGLGRIGREVAKRMLAFEMKVLGYDPFVTSDAMNSLGIEEATIDDIVRKADFISVHTPLTDQTKNLISAERIATMKPTAVLVNCARGGIVDEAALAKALEEKKIAAAAFDVFEEEPPAADHPLRKVPNAVLTPHLAASTSEAQQMVVRDLAVQILDVLRGGLVRNAANFPSIAPELQKRVDPYMALGDRLGSFLQQFAEGGVKRLIAAYHGRAAELEDVSPITTSLVYGYLKPISSTRLNYVNARHTLKSHGVEVLESRHTGEPGEFTTLVEFTAETKDGTAFRVAGTLFGKKNVSKLVRVNDIWLDATPEGNLILLENDDVPGVIGRVATLLGDHKINIAQVSWGRTKRGGMALTVINVDDPVGADVLDKLKSLPYMKTVRNIVIQ